MSDPIILTIPEEIAKQARQLAQSKQQSTEAVLLDHLKTLMPALPQAVQAELDALQYLSDDALWTIAREQMSEAIQTRAHDLMTRNTQGTLTPDEQIELEHYSERADRLMLRKAEAALILRQRGYVFTQEDFRPK